MAMTRREATAWVGMGAFAALSVWLAWPRIEAALPSKRADEDAVIALVRTALKDPESGRFSGVWLSADRQYGCGNVNAKNAMGGYVGSRAFYVQMSSGIATFYPDEEGGGSLDDKIASTQKAIDFLKTAQAVCGEPPERRN